MDYFIGQIILLSFANQSKDVSLCDGSLLQITQNSALYSLIGTNYGGDGVSTFALPNLQGAEPIPGLSYCIAIAGYYPPRS
ncbi:phage tail protein [Fusibacter sp. 3D3]|uniref:phage tail protein n=1 Tax=Fusibacter sp. 3D3 TaxID=1048380 RepID=UPI000852D529|nr:tail fiber protein [Fusibacter sp. 3D3]GAU76217.1 microcystin dependent protein [Fusibacter sp. 3D3]